MLLLSEKVLFCAQGMVLLTLSVTLPTLKPPTCRVGLAPVDCPRPTPEQHWVFYTAIYAIAVGAGGFQPCLSALGADQFDELDPAEKKHQAAFFSVYYLSLCAGALVSGSALVYVEANVGWDWGFGLATAALVVANFVLVLGNRVYRQQPPAGNPLARVTQVLVAAARKWRVHVPADDSLLHEVVDDTDAALLAHSRRKITRSRDFM